MNDRDSKINKGAGWLSSLLLHVLLGLLFLNVIMEKPEELADYAELSFSSFAPEQQPVVSKPREIISSSAARRSTGTSRPTRSVDILQRRQLERENTNVPIDQKDKIQTDESVQRLADKVDPLQGVSRGTRTVESGTAAGLRRPEGSKNINVGQKSTTDLPSQGLSGALKNDRPYEISWEGGDREIISDPLPKFPEDVFKEVVLKIRIGVLPNGTVGELIPLQKGEARLENVTLSVLKRWRFNPLEPSAPQVNQSAVVTFRFVLK